MKKSLSAILICALITGLMLTLVSCGGLSGTYDGALYDLKFSGSRVTAIVGENELDGTYEIKEKDGKKTISFDFVDEKNASEEQKYVLGIIDSILKADLPFSEEGDNITIGYLMTFTKK